MQNQRAYGLQKLFNKVIDGERAVKPQVFLEALCCGSDPVSYVARLVSSVAGKAALKASVISDTSATFINQHTSRLIQYLRYPAVGTACGGDLLRQVLTELVEPPIFWDEFVKLLEADQLSHESSDSFAWLLWQLVMLPHDHANGYVKVARRSRLRDVFSRHPEPETRNIFQAISHVVSTVSVPESGEDNGPGGRHDNDFQDFRKIHILPTVDELVSLEAPYLRFASEIDQVPGPVRVAAHLDNQFRLLREDMMREIRQEVHAISEPNSRSSRGQRIKGLYFAGYEAQVPERGIHNHQHQLALVFECQRGIIAFPRGINTEEERKKFLEKHPRIFSHESICCILVAGKLAGLGRIWRRCEEMARQVPLLYMYPSDSAIPLQHLLVSLKRRTEVELIQLNTAVFSYEPILKQLQDIRVLPLLEQIASWKPGDTLPRPAWDADTRLTDFVAALKVNSSGDLQDTLKLPQSRVLDHNQVQSLLSSLTQQIAIIQGPPGTGKSFIGALLAKAIYELTGYRILVLSYTNHALDQYLEDLMDTGIPSKDMVRLGSAQKSSARTRSLSMKEQKIQSYKMGRNDWFVVDTVKGEIQETASTIATLFQQYASAAPTKEDVMNHLELSGEYDEFYDSFGIPQTTDGFDRVGRKGKPIGKHYLLDRWCRNKDAGIFAESMGKDTPDIWQLSSNERTQYRETWLNEILQERASRLAESVIRYNTLLSRMRSIFGENDRRLLANRRIIGCTTTVAAKYVKDIQSAPPDIIIVEEAGEILESHILTALAANTKQLILIGDHKQLRPKAHFDLSVEKGMGYDLNRSLFERLVLKGFPHSVLSMQHRMRPEISVFARSMTYPELTDSENTKGRPALKGFQSSVIFVNHEVVETEVQNAFDPRDGGSTSSKNNLFEAELTLKCVKHLAQQGYRSDQIVVLTPYLGQLRLLHDVLQEENDPVLNDIDSHDLVRAGLMPDAAAAIGKQKLRISTIDNFQGEESDVVVASLTRSNKRRDIGFMASPERLNVLLTRARNGLILIGNASTFMHARNGRDLWNKFLSMLKERLSIFDGIPIQCERHTDRKFLAQTPGDFERLCPDGGCHLPCSSSLKCGHSCPQKCHQLFDHSKLPCNLILEDTCSVGHQLSWKCSSGRPALCSLCERKRKQDEAEREALFEHQQLKMKQQQEHDAQLAAYNAKIEAEYRKRETDQIAQKNESIYEQKQRDLEDAIKMAATSPITSAASKKWDGQVSISGNPFTPMPKLEITVPTVVEPMTTAPAMTVSTPTAPKTTVQVIAPISAVLAQPSVAETEWQTLKDRDGARNSALDKVMQMTGLEDVKLKFLSIFHKLATLKRQGVDLSGERMGIVLLGNPGTGKTTIARLYVDFLSTIGVLPGKKFVESTGARLASDGVKAAQKMLDDILQAGGGAFFIDEAYQLVSGHNPGGRAVLDFLLAEIENTTGKIAFIMAGYDKPMEKFFQHNVGLKDRLPHRLCFADYKENELLVMLQRKIEKKYNKSGGMKIEDGAGGLYMRIAVRRLHRGSSKEGFGNARALENMLETITTRQTTRLMRERNSGVSPDYRLLRKEDLIGPRPSSALQKSSAWQELQQMIGLTSIKQSVETLLARLQDNYDRELNEKQPIEVTLNKLFIGSPGTGKTTVARLYGRILCEIGMLSSSECVLKTPADFIGSVIGESEKNTKSILEATKGKVLVIDEAYMLSGNTGNGPNSGSDIYQTAVIDTIVSEVHSVPGEDRAVLLLGYREQMEEMLRLVNPGLARRFSLDSAFVFEDYNNQDLRLILDLKMKKQDLYASDAAKNVAIGVLSKARRKKNFGNAGEVENLLGRAKDAFQKRRKQGSTKQEFTDMMFEPQDFDPDYGRTKDAHTSCRELFKDVVGCDDMVKQLLGYVETSQKLTALGRPVENHIPFNFVFKGPPGTGKTTTARKIGRIFCDMGLLASDSVVDCSVTDLVGSFVGHTGPKVLAKLDEALGQVLFIDEAYRLGEGPFAKEAIDELVDSLTKPRYIGKLIVVLAGYDDEINKLLRVNPGLSSRFSEEVKFTNLTSQHCLKLLLRNLGRESFIKVNLSASDTEAWVIQDLFERLSELPAWGNGRDIETVSKNIIMQALRERALVDNFLHVYAGDVLDQLQTFYDSRKARASIPLSDNAEKSMNHQAAAGFSCGTPIYNVSYGANASRSSNMSSTAVQRADKATESQPDDNPIPLRVATETPAEQQQCSQEEDPVDPDPGVDPSTFRELQDAKEQARKLEKSRDDSIMQAKLQVDQVCDQIKAIEQKAVASTVSQSNQESQNNATATEDAVEARRQHEALRIEALRLKLKRNEEEARLRRMEEEIKEQRKKEALAQQKLRKMGVCPAGYHWIKMATGYRCAGGSHFVSHEQLEG